MDKTTRVQTIWIMHTCELSSDLGGPNSVLDNYSTLELIRLLAKPFPQARSPTLLSFLIHSIPDSGKENRYIKRIYCC